LGVVARAKGMAQIAARTGLSRVQLYRSFSPAGNPSLKTVVAVMSALGVELAARSPAERAAKPRRQVKRAARDAFRGRPEIVEGRRGHP
jgi:transcriptional regulator with XRE-family HTH domain